VQAGIVWKRGGEAVALQDLLIVDNNGAFAEIAGHFVVSGDERLVSSRGDICKESRTEFKRSRCY
jgi:hypothetical protein